MRRNVEHTPQHTVRRWAALTEADGVLLEALVYADKELVATSEEVNRCQERVRDAQTRREELSVAIGILQRHCQGRTHAG